MKKTACPVCEWESEGARNCPCCGWPLHSEELILAPPELLREEERKLEEARKLWQEITKSFTSGEFGVGKEAVARLQQELEKAGFAPGEALSRWAATNPPKGKGGTLQIISEIGPVPLHFEGKQYEAPIQFDNLAPGPKSLLISAWRMEFELLLEVSAGTVVRVKVNSDLIEAVRNLGTWSFHEAGQLSGHIGPIWSLAFSPDGRFIASGGADETTVVWDVSSGTSVMQWHGHRDWVRSVAFSPDGSLLASAGMDGILNLWGIRAAQEVKQLEGFGGWIFSIAFSPDGNLIAAGGEEGRIVLWERATGREIRRWQAHSGIVNSIAFHPGGRLLLSGGEDGFINLWNVETGRKIQSLEGVNRSVGAVAFHPEGHLFASGGSDGVIQIWSTEEKMEKTRLTSHEGPIRALAFHPAGRLLASGGEDAVLRLWAIPGGNLLAALDVPIHPICSLAFSPTGSFLAVGGGDPRIFLWRIRATFTPTGFLQEWPELSPPPGAWVMVQTGKETALFLDGQPVGLTSGGYRVFSEFPPGYHWIEARTPEARGMVQFEAQPGGLYLLKIPLRPLQGAIRFSGRILPQEVEVDGRRYFRPQEIDNLRPGIKEIKVMLPKREWRTRIEVPPEGTVEIQVTPSLIKALKAAERWERIHSWDGPGGAITALAFDRSGRWLAAAGSKGGISLRRLPDGESLSQLPGHSGGTTVLAFHPSSYTLASGGEDGLVRVWSVPAGREIWEMAGHSGPIKALSFHPKGQLLASGGEEGLICLWDVRSGKEIQQLKGHTASIQTLTFAKGDLLISAGADGRIGLWKVKRGEELMHLEAHAGPVRALALHPKGQMFASGGEDGRIRLWEIKTGREIRAFGDPAAPIQALIFTPEGRRLISARADGSLQCWDANSGQEIWCRNGILVRNLAIHPGGEILTAIDKDGKIWLVDARSGWPLREPPDSPSDTRCMAFSRDGRRFIAGTGDGQILLWQAAPAKEVRIFTKKRAKALIFILMIIALGAAIGLRKWPPHFTPHLKIPAPPVSYSVEQLKTPAPAVKCSGDLSTSGMEDYLTCQGSPLARLLPELGEIAAAYNVDPRLMIAIAGASSSFGKEGRCAKERNNPWGLGGDWPNCEAFPSMEASLKSAALKLWDQIHRQKVKTINDLAPLWCSTNCSKWVKQVSDFYSEQGGNPRTRDWSYVGNGGSPLPGKFRPGRMAQVSVERLRVRDGPGTQFKILDIILKGQKVKIIAGPVEADSYKWWAIEASKTLIGWSVEDGLAEPSP